METRVEITEGSLVEKCGMSKTAQIIWIALTVLLVSGWQNAFAIHANIYEPRVPKEILEAVQEIENPYPATEDQIEAGRKIYFGKGLCVTCHSKDGRGVQIPGHSPRDFTDHAASARDGPQAADLSL